MLAADPETLMEAVIARVNRTSALWQLFAFMCDLIVVEAGRARYYEELPLDYVHAALEPPELYFTITLEYGPDHDLVDPFDVSVGRIAQSDAGRGQHHGEALGDEGMAVDDDDPAAGGMVARRPGVVVVDRGRGADALDVGGGGRHHCSYRRSVDGSLNVGSHRGCCKLMTVLARG